MTSLLRTIFILALLIITPFAHATTALDDPAQEARAKAIGDELRCVVCQSQSINDSQAEMARNMREMVRDKISAGWSDQQIYDYVRSRYGDFILLKPPVQMNTLLLWLWPVLLMGLAGLLFWRNLRRRKEAL